MFTCLLFSLLCGFMVRGAPAGSVSDSLETLRTRLNGIISQPQFSKALWGIKIKMLHGENIVFQRNSSKRLKPASNAKLFTAALALDKLGSQYRIKTSFLAANRPNQAGDLVGDLTVYGRGDPTFAARFNDGDYEKAVSPLVAALRAAGVKRIQGDLIADQSFFRGPPFGSGWTWGDLQHYYGAEISALTIYDNVLDITITAGRSSGDLCNIRVRPESAFVSFINRTRTVTSNLSREFHLYRPIGKNLVYLHGRLPVDDLGFDYGVAVHDPAAFFVSQLKDALIRSGIPVKGRMRTLKWIDRVEADSPENSLVEIAFVHSRTLGEILPQMLKPSQNLYSQLLLLQVGAMGRRFIEVEHSELDLVSENAVENRQLVSNVRFLEPTTEETGLLEMQRFVRELGIDPNEVLLDDGSGLSRRSLVTADAIVDLLIHMHRHPEGGVFRDSLPVAGVEGTLKRRMIGTRAQGNVRAKTGSLQHVTALSGYLSTAGGEPMVFSILLNHHAGDQTEARSAIDEMVETLAEFGEPVSRSSVIDVD